MWYFANFCLMCLCALISSAVSAPCECKEYYISTTIKADFYQATKLCKADGMNLVSIKTRGQLFDIIDKIDALGPAFSGETFWTSGTDAEKEGSFVWASGDPVTLSNWNSGEPNNNLVKDGDLEKAHLEEDCMEITAKAMNYKFNDVSCTGNGSSYLKYFVCEKSNSSAAIHPATV